MRVTRKDVKQRAWECVGGRIQILKSEMTWWTAQTIITIFSEKFSLAFFII